jgi:SAM-dependent methyltransferase
MASIAVGASARCAVLFTGGNLMGLIDTVKAHTPWAIRNGAREIRRRIRWVRNSRRPVDEVFQEVYQRAMWGGEIGNFFSGPGSDSDAAAHYAAGIAELIATRGIRSVVDLGCGDFRVAERFLGDSDVSYMGVDVVEALVRQNIANHRNARIDFACRNIITDPLPDGELCLIREVLQHLSNAQILRVIPKLRQYRYVVYSDYQPGPSVPCVPNRDIGHGIDTRIWKDSALYLDQPPFHVPMTLLFEAPSPIVLRNPGESIRTYLLWP